MVRSHGPARRHLDRRGGDSAGRARHDFPTAGHAWALGITRIAQGVGLQSWTTPAGTEPVPEGFGLLLFE